MTAFGGNIAPYPPIQNGKQKRGGLILPADFAQLLTAAERTKLAALYAAPPRARVTSSAQQIIGTGAITVLTYDTETFDASGYHDPATNPGRLTVPAGQGGLFQVGLWATWDAQAGGGRRSFAIRHQGATVIGAVEQAPNGTATFPTFAFSAPYQAAAGEYFDSYAFHDRGSNLGVLAGYTFWVVRLGD